MRVKWWYWVLLRPGFSNVYRRPCRWIHFGADRALGQTVAEGKVGFKEWL